MANPRKLPARIEELAFHDTGVCILRLRSEVKLPRFKPGQFLHLALDRFDPSDGFWPESRVFSIALAPSDQEIVLAYSVKGTFTSRMRDELHIGSSVWIKLPYGAFIIDELAGSTDPIILVAGGTGITAFVSFLEKEANGLSSRRIRLFYGARNESLLIFRERVAKAATSCPKFSYELYLEEPGSLDPTESTHGRLKAEPIIESYREMGCSHIFLAGPPAMLDSFRPALEGAGIPDGKIHVDNWE